jgi:nucleoid-associated protein YejK
MFEAIEERGLIYNGSDFDGAGGLGQFDDILSELDKQGAIEENMLFLDRAKSLEIDNMLAAQNSYGAGGTSYGVFNNEEDMALNLGFSGFRRGSYDFYKTDWK